jgi:hypothetical protein
MGQQLSIEDLMKHQSILAMLIQRHLKPPAFDPLETSVMNTLENDLPKCRQKNQLVLSRQWPSVRRCAPGRGFGSLCSNRQMRCAP